MTQLTTTQIDAFFERKGINKSGICSEAGITITQYNQIKRGDNGRKMTPFVSDRLEKVMRRYGWPENK